MEQRGPGFLRLPYAVGAGVLDGLLISLALGVFWGTGFAAVQAIRIDRIQEAFPVGGSPAQTMPGEGVTRITPEASGM